jgi:Rps23 Pro-64 3,4-dihydroxylase Tpa1-like proline 4-hydroxylase
MEKIIVWKNFFSQEEKNIINNEGETAYWELSGWSQQTPHTRFFWFKDLINCSCSIKLFTDKIENYFNSKIEIIRLYANGQAHGQCGMFHTDVEPTEQGEFYSLVYYLHEDWKPEYGGHLMIKDGDNIESYWPESNSSIIFNSKLWHCPLEPTIYCRTQRLSIAFKFKIL